MKIFANLLIILMTAFTLSVIPINKDVFKVDLGQYFQSEEPVETVEEVIELPVYQLGLESDTFLNGHQDVAIQIESTQDILAVDDLLNTLSVKYRNGSNDATTIKLTDLASLDYQVNGKLLTITFNTSDITLPIGTSNFEVFTTDENFETKSTVFEVSLVTDKTYVWSNNLEAQAGFYYRTLYFPSDDGNYIIPTSVVVKDNGNLTRDLFNALYAGPKENVGLKVGNPIPYAANISNYNSISTYSINNAEANKYMETHTNSDAFATMLANTMTQLSFIDGVVIDASAGILKLEDANKVYAPMNGPIAYLGYLSNTEYAYLAPTALEGTTPQDMFLALRGDESKAMYSPQTIPVIPSNVDLLSSRIEENVIYLDLSKEMLNAFGGNNNMISMMMDSIIYSFKSLDGVEKVSLTIDGETPTDFFGYDLTRQFSGNKNMNLQP